MAVAQPLITVTDDPPSCKNGHEMTGTNILMEKSGADRVVRPRCRTCKRDSHTRWLRRTQGYGDGINPKSMLMPRSARSVRNGEYATATLFSLLPREMRKAVAGVLLDQRVDRLQRAVIQRCADTRCWSGTNEEVAARLFVEAALNQVIDARSRSLRIDVLLGLFLGA